MDGNKPTFENKRDFAIKNGLPLKYVTYIDGEISSLLEKAYDVFDKYYVDGNKREVFDFFHKNSDIDDSDIINMYIYYLFGSTNDFFIYSDYTNFARSPKFDTSLMFRNLPCGGNKEPDSFTGTEIEEDQSSIPLMEDSFFMKDFIETWYEKVKEKQPNYSHDDIIVFLFERRVLQLANCLNGSNKFESFTSLMGNQIAWFNELTSEVDKLLSESEAQQKLQDYITKKVKDSNSTIEIREFEISKTFDTYSLFMSDGAPPSIEDGLDIFNHAVASLHVPYIKYVDQYGNAYHKIYTGDKIDTSKNPNYSKTIFGLDSHNERNVIYLNIWKGDINEDSYFDSKQVLFEVIDYDISDNTLTTTINIENIIKALPSVTFSNATEGNISGILDIFTNIEIDEGTFLDYILNDEIGKQYLYVDETNNAISKRKYSYNFKNKVGEGNDLSFKMEKEISSSEKVINIIDSDKKVIKPSGSPYYKLSVQKMKNNSTISVFSRIIEGIISDYAEKREDILKIYKAIYPNLNYSQDIGDARDEVIEAPKIDLLQRNYPQLFGEKSYYSTACPPKAQPTVIGQDEVQFWKQKGRKVLTIQNREKNNINLVCAGDSKIHPGFTINNRVTSKNIDIERLAPCCFTSEKDDLGTMLDKLRQGEQPSGRKDYILKTDNVVDNEIVALLPPMISDTLKKIGKYSEIGTISRMGVPISKNSFLHCLLAATDNEGYYNSILKENYVRDCREAIISKINPLLLSQELYDFSEEEIISKLTAIGEDGDYENYLEPRVYYRALEELFGVNIYVFSGFTNEIMEIPRYKQYHCRPVRSYRPTVLIYKNYGTDVNKVSQPQCELIVSYNVEKNEIVKLFGSDMSRECHDILKESLRTLTLKISDVNTVYLNENYYWDSLEFLETQNSDIISQKIDSYGKVRIIDIKVDNEEFSLFVKPSQPENFKIAKLDENFELKETTYSKAREIFGNESMRGERGAWFSAFGVPDFFYIKVMDMPNLTVNAPDPGDIDDPTIVSRSTRLRDATKILNIIKELVSWVLAKSGLDSDEFSEKYLEVFESDNTDSLIYYDFSNLKRKLPTSNNIGSIISEFEKSIPTLFRSGKIIMYSEKFRNLFAKYLEDTQEDPNKTHMEYYYQDTRDFSYSNTNQVFTNSYDFKMWLSMNNPDYKKIRTSLERSDISVIPYVYQDENLNVYIIQGTNEGTIEASLEVGRIWNDYHVNIGPDIQPSRNKVIPKHKIFIISENKTLTAVKDYSFGDSEYLRILFHGNVMNVGNKSINTRLYSAILKVN